MTRALRAPLAALSVLAAPVLVHVAILRHDRLLEWLALLLFAAVMLADGLVRLRAASWLAWAALGVAFGWLVTRGDARFALQLPSILVPAMLAAVFAATLRSGREALITRIATATWGGELPAELRDYTRALTRFWVLVFVVLTATAALLAAFAPYAVWSFVANFGAYAIVSSVLLAEYVYRRWRFRNYPHPSFVEYVGILCRADLRRVS